MIFFFFFPDQCNQPSSYSIAIWFLSFTYYIILRQMKKNKND